jgi:hypothetical protein
LAAVVGRYVIVILVSPVRVRTFCNLNAVRVAIGHGAVPSRSTTPCVSSTSTAARMRSDVTEGDVDDCASRVVARATHVSTVDTEAAEKQGIGIAAS